MAAEKVLQIYRLRWRIEIIFKACKSYTALNAIAAHRSNVYHVKAMLYAWLCVLVLATATGAFALAVANRTGELRPNYLSLLRVVSKVFEMISGVMSWCYAPAGEILERWSYQMNYHDCYDKRKSRTNMAEMLEETVGLSPLEINIPGEIGAPKSLS